MKLRVLYRCNHDATVDADKPLTPQCPTCGERRIARVLNAKPPRIVGTARGPLVETRDLPAIAVNLGATTDAQ